MNILKIMGLFLWLISQAGNAQSQVPIGDVLDEDLLDSLIVVEINRAREEKGLTKFVSSQNVRKYISLRNTMIMVEKDSLFHPKLPKTQEFKDQLLIIQSDYNKVNPVRDTSFNHMTYRGEISIFLLGRFNYDELAHKCVETWLNSPQHYDIMMNNWCREKHIMLVGASAKKVGKNTFYVSVNIVAFNVSPF
jgi:hypothetical protein